MQGCLLFCFSMPPVVTIEKIAYQQIDFDDLTYAIAPVEDNVVDANLKESIAEYGLLHPPMVRATAPGFYIIVAGRKRLLAMRSLAPGGKCPCLVVPMQAPEYTVFHLLLTERQLSRQLTPIEKALFLHKAAAVTDSERISREFLPRLGIAPDPYMLQQTLMLLELEEPILRGIHQGDVNEITARDFLSFSAQDRMVLYEIINALRLSFSNQKKLLQLCRTLAGRKNISIAALLDNSAVHGILQHEDANPPQKTKKLMTWLAGEHMPRSSQAEHEFNLFIKKMQLPANASVTHTPFFEDDALTLAITFPNRDSLQQAWEKIKHATRNSDN